MGNRIFLSVIFTAAAYLFYSTFFFKKNFIARTSSPESMPRVFLVSILIVTLLLFIRDYKKDLSSHVMELFTGTRLYVVLALPLYLLALPWLGFTVSTFLLLTLLFGILAKNKPSVRGVLVNAFMAACLSSLTFFLFREVFHIQLPVNMFDI